MYPKILKPLFDLLIALIGFLFLLPVFILVTLMLFIVNGGSPFFLQWRPGEQGKLFRIIKFKTMNDKKDASGRLLPDSDRLTLVGRIIRKTSLDEVPQLLNVIKGDMSLVGPRPLLPEYLKLYTDFQRQRHLVKPGITGWAQVNGRNAISWNRKFEYDVWYVQHLSFLLDMKILWLTFLKVLKTEGINTANMATTEHFNGHN